MAQRRCIGCRRLIAKGSRCSRCSARSPSALATGNRAWRRLRAQIIARDGGRCRQCGSAERLEVHHVVPVADGGTNAASNLVTLCFDHHPRG